jgi:ATP-binding cassette subfamily B protein
MVLQDSVLFAVSIRDNIAYGNLQAGANEVEQAASLANAHEFIIALPEGYDTVVGERGATLSGGQLQRIAIARAVIRQAPIMLLDEPTQGLDNLNRREVDAALDRCTRGRTTLLASHDLLASRDYDRLLVIDHGGIVECGSHDELMQQQGYYRRLYLHQFREQQGDGENPARPSLVSG